MKNRRGIFIVILLLLCFVFTGCDNSTNNNVSDTPTNEEKTHGGTLRIAASRYETLNPLLNKDKDVDQILQLIFDPIMKIGSDLKPTAYLAESVVVDNVGASIDVKLKDNVVFHNGDKLTADDVIYSLDVLKKATDDVLYKNVMSNIGTYKKIDELTVRIYLRQVYSNPEYALCFPVVSKSYYENKGSDTVNNAMGTGMFKIETVSQMQEIILQRNEEYFGEKPYIDKVSVTLVPNEKTIQTAFKQKQIDVMFTQDMIAGQYTGNNSIKMMKYATMNYDFIGFNFNNTLLSNSELRRIIAHAIDKKSIIKNVYYGYAVIAETMIHPNSFLYTAETSSYEYDIKMAKNLLLDLNIPANKLNFRLLVNSENSERNEIAEIIKSNLEAIGITVNIEKVPFEQYKQKIESKDFDLLLGGWHLLTNQDISFAYSSSNIYAGQNYISYNSKEMDEILKQTYTQVGEVNVKSAFSTLQEFLGKELPYISIDFRENVGYLNSVNVGGTLTPLEHNYYNGIENLYIRKK